VATFYFLFFYFFIFLNSKKVREKFPLNYLFFIYFKLFNLIQVNLVNPDFFYLYSFLPFFIFIYYYYQNFPLSSGQK
jgi:hypothetical protein